MGRTAAHLLCLLLLALGASGCWRPSVSTTPAHQAVVSDNQPALRHPLNIGITVHIALDVDRQAFHYFAALDAMCTKYPEQCTYRLVPGEAVIIDARTNVGNGWGYGVMPANRGPRPNVVVAVAQSELVP